MHPTLRRHSDGLSSGLAHSAFRNLMPNARNLRSDQFVEELILTVMV